MDPTTVSDIRRERVVAVNRHAVVGPPPPGGAADSRSACIELRAFSLGQRWDSRFSMGETWFGSVDIGNLDSDPALELVFGSNRWNPEIIVYDNGGIWTRFQAFPDWVGVGVGVAVRRVNLLG
jgi:hypothetical protein